MSDWIEALVTQGNAGTTAALVTVVVTRGSVPRAPGTRMVVTSEAIDGTIGGGHLEHKSIAIARCLIADGGAAALHRFPLGASLGQCCGGVALLLFEPVAPNAAWLDALVRRRAAGAACALVTPVRGDGSEGRLVVTAADCVGTLGSAAQDREVVAHARAVLADAREPGVVTLGDDGGIECFVDVVRPSDFHIVIFGAGHVGRAVVRALADIRCRITWVDTRETPFPPGMPNHVECVATDTPEAEVTAAPAGAFFLVMTHSHPQDEALAERILTRGNFAYFGLIGSRSKRRQFERRMAARGMPRSRFAVMTCPIGVAGIAGKEPEVIAIAVVAELLQVRSRQAAAGSGYASRCVRP